MIDLSKCKKGDKLRLRNGDIAELEGQHRDDSSNQFLIRNKNSGLLETVTNCGRWHSKYWISSLSNCPGDVVEIIKDMKTAQQRIEEIESLMKQQAQELEKLKKEVEDEEWEPGEYDVDYIVFDNCKDPDWNEDKFQKIRDFNHLLELSRYTNSKFESEFDHVVCYMDGGWAPASNNVIKGIGTIFTSFESAELACKILNKKGWRMKSFY